MKSLSVLLVFGWSLYTQQAFWKLEVIPIGIYGWGQGHIDSYT